MTKESYIAAALVDASRRMEWRYSDGEMGSDFYEEQWDDDDCTYMVAGYSGDWEAIAFCGTDSETGSYLSEVELGAHNTMVEAMVACLLHAATYDGELRYLESQISEE